MVYFLEAAPKFEDPVLVAFATEATILRVDGTREVKRIIVIDIFLRSFYVQSKRSK